MPKSNDAVEQTANDLPEMEGNVTVANPAPSPISDPELEPNDGAQKEKTSTKEVVGRVFFGRKLDANRVPQHFVPGTAKITIDKAAFEDVVNKIRIENPGQKTGRFYIRQTAIEDPENPGKYKTAPLELNPAKPHADAYIYRETSEDTLTHLNAKDFSDFFVTLNFDQVLAAPVSVYERNTTNDQGEAVKETVETIKLDLHPKIMKAVNEDMMFQVDWKVDPNRKAPTQKEVASGQASKAEMDDYYQNNVKVVGNAGTHNLYQFSNSIRETDVTLENLQNLLSKNADSFVSNVVQKFPMQVASFSKELLVPKGSRTEFVLNQKGYQFKSVNKLNEKTNTQSFNQELAKKIDAKKNKNSQGIH